MEHLISTAEVAIIIALAELWKKLELPKRWIPLFDVVLGLIFGMIGFFRGKTDLYTAIMIGLAEGLSACGLFSGTRNTLQKDS